MDLGFRDLGSRDLGFESPELYTPDTKPLKPAQGTQKLCNIPSLRNIGLYRVL